MVSSRTVVVNCVGTDWRPEDEALKVRLGCHDGDPEGYKDLIKNLAHKISHY